MTRSLRTLFFALPALAVALAVGAPLQAQGGAHTSKRFAGPKVNAGTVTHTQKAGQDVLTLSSDFVVPDTPDPHWQVVDSKGQVFLLQRLPIKGGLTGDKINTSIVVPDYVKDIAKVQIYCAWAEVVLGETTFDRTISTTN
jgi:hypothetical protein